MNNVLESAKNATITQFQPFKVLCTTNNDFIWAHFILKYIVLNMYNIQRP